MTPVTRMNDLVYKRISIPLSSASKYAKGKFHLRKYTEFER
jgi:hypothetical protein